MIGLYGAEYDRRSLAQRTGSLSQFAGVQAYTLSDGVERGIRCLEFRTGTGFVFKVLVDRALDVAAAEYRGAAIGWHSPTGFRHPGLHEYNDEGGLSWLRSLSGLIVTAGLDHTLFMDTDTAEHYVYAPRQSVSSSLHGRIGMLPARLVGYGEEWRGDECYLWCEGVVVQATVFGEDLHLVRRIEVKVGESAFTLKDRVLNHGFYRTPHMFLYHVNLGHPVLSEHSVFRAPVRETIWASHENELESQGVGYFNQSEPKRNFHEQVFEHSIAADEADVVPVALINPAFDGGKGIGFMVEFNKREFPCMFQWQNYQQGLYAMAIEPSTNHVLGKPFAKERDELRWLEHGEEYSYTTRFTVLENHDQIASAEARIDSICAQQKDDFPEITGNWDA